MKRVVAVAVAFLCTFGAMGVSRAAPETEDAAAAGSAAKGADGFGCLDDLLQDYERQQLAWLPVVLPDPDCVHIQDGGLRVFDPQGFPEELVQGLVPSRLENLTVWQITV